jgi:hypothetical protein
MAEEIIKALMRLENAEAKVNIRGGKIVKIPAQKIELPLRDGVQTILIIPADIVEKTEN